jgi:hypothetical protein
LVTGRVGASDDGFGSDQSFKSELATHGMMERTKAGKIHALVSELT